MRRSAAVVALALSCLGCGSLLSQRVDLAITSLPVDEGACYGTSWIVDLVADPRFGTVFRDVRDPEHAGKLYWPAGYTGSRLGSEVAVRDLTGKVVALTGGTYVVSMAKYPTGESPEGLIASALCIREWPAGATIPPP